MFRKETLRQAIKEVNVMSPEIVLVTGDLTENGLVSEFEMAVVELKILKADKIIYIGGNHDYRSTGCLLFEEYLAFSQVTETDEATRALNDLRNKLKQLLHNKSTFGLHFRIFDENIGSESYLAVVEYSHEWNPSSQFELQVSYREKPALPLSKLPLCDELYFKFCEFQSFSVNCIYKEELLAEKIRAAFQRIRSRDLYDLYLFTKRHYNRDIVKKLAVIKCWSAREPFDPKALLEKVADGNYDWDDLQRLVRRGSLPSPEDLVKAVLTEYSYLENFDRQLLKIAEDSRAHKEKKLVVEVLSKIVSA